MYYMGLGHNMRYMLCAYDIHFGVWVAGSYDASHSETM